MKVGDTIEVKQFCFTNPYGGTGMSDSQFDEKFTGKAVLKITQLWDDYECGIRGWADPVNQELKDYLKRNAKQTLDISKFPIVEDGKMVYSETHIPANTVFWSEFDIVEK